MKKVLLGAALLGSLAVGGCQSAKDTYDAPKPLDKMSNEEWCGFYGSYLGKTTLPPATRKQDIDRMRSRGCPNIPAS